MKRQLGWLLAAAFTGLSASSCSVPTSFACTSDSQCGVGQCIVGGCAFPSDDCLSGLKFGSLSPEQLAGLCVGVDSGVADQDGSGEDTTFDTTVDSGATSTSAGSSTGDSGDSESGDSESGDTESGSSESGTNESDTTDTGTTAGEIPDTAIAHYSFDDIVLPTIFDSTGNGFDAEMDNLQQGVPGVVGEGLSFGNLDRVIVPLEVLAGRTAFTIEYYMFVSPPLADRQFVFYYGNEFDTAATPNLTYYVEYVFGPPKTSRVIWTTDSAAGLVGTSNVAEGGWHHIGMTFSGAGMRLYVDHFLDAEDPMVLGLLSPNLAWIQIGGIPSGFASFSGIIDELRFSEGALTPAQMQPIP